MGNLDLVSRLLAERHLVDLLPSLLPGRTIEVLRTLRTELKEVTERIADDVVLARLDGVETIVHIELESRHNPELDHRIAVYHAMLLRKYAPRPVLSLVVYLMHRPPRAPISPGLPKRRGAQMHFDYIAFCPWEHALGIEEIRAHPALAPIACLTPAISEEDLPAVRDAVLAAPMSRSEKLDCLAFVHILGGLRFSPKLLNSIIRSDEMEDSPTYQAIIARGRQLGRQEGRQEGRKEGRQALLGVVLAMLQTRLGVPVHDDLEATLSALDAEALESFSAELLGTQDDVALRALLARLPEPRRR